MSKFKITNVEIGDKVFLKSVRFYGGDEETFKISFQLDGEDLTLYFTPIKDNQNANGAIKVNKDKTNEKEIYFELVNFAQNNLTTSAIRFISSGEKEHYSFQISANVLSSSKNNGAICLYEVVFYKEAPQNG